MLNTNTKVGKPSLTVTNYPKIQAIVTLKG